MSFLRPAGVALAAALALPSASGVFRSVEDWWRHLDVFGQRLANPVKISLWSYGKAIPAGE